MNADGLERKTYSLNLDLEAALEIFLGEGFRRVWGLAKKDEEIRNIVILSARYATDEAVILALGPDPEDERKAILATVAFEVTFYGITMSPRASNVRDSICNDLKERLNEKKPHVRLTLLAATNDLVSSRAEAHALKPTKSKMAVGVGFLRELPRYYLYVILGTLVVLSVDIVLLSMAYFGHWAEFDFGLSVDVAVLVALALTIELGVSLREEILRKRSESTP